jgi:protein SCO1
MQPRPSDYLRACHPVARRLRFRLVGRGFVAFLLFLGMADTAPAQPSVPAPLHDVGFDQKLNEQVPLDLAFRDEADRPVHLGDYFQGKPVILVLAYFRCPMLCSEVLNGLVRGMLDLPFDAGKEFEVVTVSFDPTETPEMARAKKQTYVQRYGRPGAADGWHFLTGKEDAIRRLTQAVGFRYHYDAAHQQYAHASGIMILTPTGRISRYFFDIQYPSRDLRLGLVEASENRIGSAADQVLLFCFHYDPIEGRYGPAVMNIVRALSALTVLIIASIYVVLWWRWRRSRRDGSVSDRREPRSSGG